MAIPADPERHPHEDLCGRLDAGRAEVVRQSAGMCVGHVPVGELAVLLVGPYTPRANEQVMVIGLRLRPRSTTENSYWERMKLSMFCN